MAGFITTAVPICDGSFGNQVGMNSVLRCKSNVAVANEMVIPQVSIPNRKRRLDHLTLEEKVQRKKLRNRVSAQSSRDRKRARLDDLEAEVKALREKNEALTDQCQNLQLENQQLFQKLSNMEYNHQTHGVSCSTQVERGDFMIEPLLQGQALQVAVPEASGFDYVDSPEVLASVAHLDSLGVEACVLNLDELADNICREPAEEMDNDTELLSSLPRLDGLDVDECLRNTDGLAQDTFRELAEEVDKDSELLISVPDLLDILDVDIFVCCLDDWEQSPLREAAEEMDTEHRQASAEV
jgi:hypothetical protein